VIPANIRFGPYSTVDDVKLENKFAVVPLTVPLYEDMQKSISQISKATAKLRNAFGSVYTTYFLSKIATLFFPYFFT